MSVIQKQFVSNTSAIRTMSKKNILIGFLIFIALLGFLNKDYLLEELPNKIFGPQRFKEETLEIVLSTPATDLSEYSLNLNNLIRTANTYEGLVAFDRNLKIFLSRYPGLR